MSACMRFRISRFHFQYGMMLWRWWRSFTIRYFWQNRLLFYTNEVIFPYEQYPYTRNLRIRRTPYTCGDASRISGRIIYFGKWNGLFLWWFTRKFGKTSPTSPSHAYYRKRISETRSSNRTIWCHSRYIRGYIYHAFANTPAYKRYHSTSDTHRWYSMKHDATRSRYITRENLFLRDTRTRPVNGDRNVSNLTPMNTGKSAGYYARPKSSS